MDYIYIFRNHLRIGPKIAGFLASHYQNQCPMRNFIAWYLESHVSREKPRDLVLTIGRFLKAVSKGEKRNFALTEVLDLKLNDMIMVYDFLDANMRLFVSKISIHASVETLSKVNMNVMWDIWEPTLAEDLGFGELLTVQEIESMETSKIPHDADLLRCTKRTRHE
jgi:hypothetical protein